MNRWRTACNAGAQSSFTVGTATAAPGQTATGFIDVPAKSDPGTRIPVAVVRGVNYTVREVNADGTGIATLLLEKS